MDTHHRAFPLAPGQPTHDEQNKESQSGYLIKSEEPSVYSSAATSPILEDQGRAKIPLYQEPVNKTIYATNAEVNDSFYSVRSHLDVDYDYATDTREAVTQGVVKPNDEPRRTPSVHFHEHRTVTRSFTELNPALLPKQHWSRDQATGRVVKTPDESGTRLIT